MSSGISGIGGAAGGGSANGAASQVELGGLDKNQFLELLVGQLKNQNPLNPVGSQEFMSQMAAFSTLEQVTNLAASTEQLNEMTATNQTLALVGRQVTYTKPDGTSAEGQVESVDFEEGGYSLTVAGESGVQSGAVTQVR